MEIKKINKSVRIDLKEKLKEVLPEVFEDNKVNCEKLNSLLSDEVIEKEDDRFYFNWAGKSSLYKLIQAPAYGTLKPDKEKSVDFDNTENIVIVGENLETLKLLLKPYFGKVKMIYIDPPYNTGKDFIYRDNFKEPLKDYLEKTGQIDSEGKKLTTNTEASGRYHSDWLNFMYPRLFLARNLLRDDGVIFISIDDHEVHHLRMIMDEIFGEENFLGIISVVNNLKGRSDDEYIATANEFLLVCTKNKGEYEMGGLPLTKEQLNEYDKEDQYGKYKEVGFRKTGKGWKRKDRPNMFYPIYFNQKTGQISLERQKQEDIEILPLTNDGQEGRWRWDKERFLERKDKDVVIRELSTGKWNVFTKMRLNENGEDRTLLPKSVWIDPKFDTAKGAKILKEFFGKDVFDNPKPIDFIIDILRISTDNDSFILDFFAGSGTTGHAVWDLNKEDGGNRKFILVQLDEEVQDEEIKK
ncbi:MAG: site-specific DNA-methyltransferase, partial [Candidatus Hydrothermae bacterium]|nr:site-specific DNA-methyltransferase [Candidatus Hydrothermae bacterium]